MLTGPSFIIVKKLKICTYIYYFKYHHLSIFSCLIEITQVCYIRKQNEILHAHNKYEAFHELHQRLLKLPQYSHNILRT